MKRFCLLVFLAMMAGAFCVSAQNVLFYSSKQGLSNTRMRNLYEDYRGNIWLTTQNGLNRFDGVKWNVYWHVIGDDTSLTNDESTCVYDYEPGKLLVGTNGDLHLFDYATDRFQRIPFLSSSGDTIHGRVISINRVRSGQTLVCYAGYGVAQLMTDEATGQLVTKSTTEFNSDHIGSYGIQFLEDRQKRLWILNGRWQLYREDGKKFRSYDEMHNVCFICMSTSGQIYAATFSNGLFRYNEAADSFEKIAQGSDFGGVVISGNAWTHGRLFICTEGGGLFIYDEDKARLSRSTLSLKDFDLATSTISYAISDAYGNLWACVSRRGVMMKPINQSPFEYIGQHSITRNTIGVNSVFTMAKATRRGHLEPDQIWVAAFNDGLYCISADGQQSEHWDKEKAPNMPIGFTTIMQVDDRTVLLGTFNEGLWIMRDDKFSRQPVDIDHVFEIQPALEPRCYWIATMGEGFYYYRLDTNQLIRYDSSKNRNEGEPYFTGNPYVYTLLQCGDQLYVGTADGLKVAHPEKDGTIKRDSHNMLDAHTIRHLALSPDEESIWAATNYGLYCVNRKTLEVRAFNTEDGLPVNSLASLCFDDGKLWIGTDYGISCLDLQTETFTNFFAEDGLQDNEFSRGAALKMGENIYFGGISGMTYFSAERLKDWMKKGQQMKLRLVDVFVGAKAAHVGDMSGRYQMLQGLIDDNPHLEVNYSENHFTLELCVMGLNNQHVTYEYSINDGPWTDQGGNSSRLVFNNLEPGTYHVRLRAAALGLSSEIREMVVVVHPAWYASGWAKTVYVILALLVCWLVYEYLRRRASIRRVMARHRQQKELNDARVQFFMNISHEIRTPMTLILAPLEKLIGSDSDGERQRNYKLIKQNAKRILRLINQMMDVRKIEQGRFLLDYHQVELVSFLQNIFDVFASNAQSRAIDYVFDHDVESLQVYVDPDNTDKIVMNLLSNAFKFTPDGGRISLQLIVRDADFDIKVTDSGIGIKDEDKHKVFERFYSAQHQNGYIGTGIGLNLTSLLVKLHKGDIRVLDNPEGQGSQFVVTMPVGEAGLRQVEPQQVDEATEVQMDEQQTAELLTIENLTETRHRNALLVEDDEAIRQYVHSELSKDLAVHLCSNGQEAWDYIVAHPGKVDIVVSDIMMPVMDGLTLCQKLKANFNTNHIPIVLMTALGSDADRIAGITNGADAYVSKPFNIDVLRTTIVQLMKSRQLLQGKFHGDKQQEEKIDRVEMESPDEHLMKRVMRVINENMSNSELSVEIIADKVGISRVHFYRKMKELTGQAPRDYVKYVRLKEAARLLAEKKLDITGVSIATGFKSLSAFSTNFKALYGLSPTEWVKNASETDA